MKEIVVLRDDLISLTYGRPDTPLLLFEHSSTVSAHKKEEIYILLASFLLTATLQMLLVTRKKYQLIPNPLYCPPNKIQEDHPVIKRKFR